MTKRTSSPRIAILSALVLVALGLVIPQVLVSYAEIQRRAVDFETFDRPLHYDLSSMESLCQMAELSPLTRARAQHVRAELYAAAAREIYLDGMYGRSQRHFNAAWGYFERAAELEPTADLIGYWLSVASRWGQHDKVLRLSRDFPQWADSGALATAYLVRGNFEAAQPLLHQRCLESSSFIECRSATLLAALLERWEPSLQAADKMVELMRREEGGDETFKDVVAEAILEGKVLHARIAVQATDLEAAEQMFREVVAANRANSQPQAAIGLADLLQESGKSEEARKVLFAPVAKGGRGEEALVARRVLTLLNEEDVEGALVELERFYNESRPNQLESVRFSASSLPEALSNKDRHEFLLALKALFEAEEHTARARRPYVSVLADACHLHLLDLQQQQFKECLYQLEAIVEPQSLLGFRCYGADRQNNYEAALQIAKSAPDGSMDKQRIVALLNLGQFNGAAEVIGKADSPVVSRQAAQVIEVLASIDAETVEPPEPGSDNVKEKSIVRAVLALLEADTPAALMGLGAQDLDYDLFRHGEWEIIGAALFRQTDKSAFRFVLQGYANDMAQSYFYRQLDLMQMLGSIGDLQHEAEQKQMQQIIAKHREARQKLNNIRWGLSR